MTRVVVINGLRGDSRPTTVQNVLAFSRYLATNEILNVNVFGLVPEVRNLSAVILTYDFLALRNRPIWKVLVRRVQSLIESAPVRIAMPQDDYTCCDILDQFICDLGITHVYTPINRDLEVLYPHATARSVKFFEALTGYVDVAEFNRVSQFSRPFSERQTDVGQRIRLLPPHLGSEAGEKGKLAIEFSKRAREAGFECDVSTRSEDVLLGDDWYRFLGNSKYTVSAKGGATLADPKGKLADQVRRMHLRESTVSNNVINSRLKRHLGRTGNFTAISPRIFEASAMGVCQILKRDDYFDGFEAWKHYVPIEKDSDPFNDVFDLMRDDARAIEIVKASQEFLLNSDEYTYKNFLRGLSKEIGLAASVATQQVTDSSTELDRAVGDNGEALVWLQSYLSRAMASGTLRKVERLLASGTFFCLSDEDKAWISHAENCKESILLWVQALLSKRLIVESVVIPWRSVSSYLQS